jgi:hypothetical protein
MLALRGAAQRASTGVGMGAGMLGGVRWVPAVARALSAEAGEVPYPRREWTRRERSLFVDETKEVMPRMADHGFRFYTLPDQLQGRSDKVQRALSTFTASRPEMRTFRRHQLIRRFRQHVFDTGSPRVQGTWPRAAWSNFSPAPLRVRALPLPRQRSQVAHTKVSRAQWPSRRSASRR